MKKHFFKQVLQLLLKFCLQTEVFIRD